MYQDQHIILSGIPRLVLFPVLGLNGQLSWNLLSYSSKYALTSFLDLLSLNTSIFVCF